MSVSHERASVEQIEAVIGPEEETVAALVADQDVREAVAIATCNRFEAYVVADDRETGREALAPLVSELPSEAVAELGHEASLRHLMRVAAGVESLVLGEDQILGQVRDAYQTAREAGAVGRVLDDALVKAIRVGERARTETAINEGIVSLGSAAVELARSERDLSDATGLVVGAGEMGSLAAAALSDAVADLIVANRTLERAERVAAEVDASAVALGALPVALSEADVVVVATSSTDPVVDADALANAGETFVVDIGQPRDVAPDAADLPAVTVRDLDALETVTEETRARRRAAVSAVEDLVDEELDRLLVQYKRKRADQVIATMYEGAERVKETEIRKATSQLAAADSPDEREAVLEALADALVGQLLAAPTQSLREAAENDDWETIHTALKLFDPQIDDAVTDDFSEAVGVPPAVVEQLTDD
ncbi:MAG: glutamyl-tRNA reductase [Haloarculaceae archaeon]